MPWSSGAPYWSAKDPAATMCPFHTWHSDDSPALFAPENLLSSYFKTNGPARGGEHTDCKIETETEDGVPTEFNGFQVVTFQPRGTEKCTVTIASFDLATSPANGAATYFLVQAKLWKPAALRLTIDPGQSANGSTPGVQSGPTL